jgi:predicted DsbA family dithiol-disulfide isomerase
MKKTTTPLLYSGLLSGALLLGSLNGCSQGQSNTEKVNEILTINPLNTEKMKIEIWSDVMCPFCYIGKRKFEKALEQFGQRDNIEVEWKSFQLNPGLKTDPSRNTIQHLAESKGWTMEYTRNTIKYVTEMAAGVGLHYDFDRAVVANSFDAHRFIQYAKTKGKGDAAEEALFKAYFTDGKNTADHAILAGLGEAIGLDKAAVSKVLAGTDFSDEVQRDIAESQKIGVTGVPFFVIDRKYAISGAQDPSMFLEAISKAWSEHEASGQPVNPSPGAQGAVCTPEGECK